MIQSIAAAIAVFIMFTHPAAAETDYEVVAEFGADVGPGNIAVSPEGRIFMSLHRFWGAPHRVVEVMADGRVEPYPNEVWANPPEGDGPGLNGVLGLRADREGILWMLDNPGEGQVGKLVGWNTRTETLERVIPLAPPVVREDIFLNDLAVDRENEAVYIADTASPDFAALIVVDLKTGRTRRVLEGSRFTRPEDIDMVIDGRVVTLGGDPARVGVNPITIDPTNSWVYFGAMNGTSIYRVRTTDLLDESLSPQDLEARVERYGDKPVSDGSTIDGGGNVYITDITNDAVGIVRRDGGYETLFADDTLSWPDGFAYGPDDFIYATVNELHRAPALNNGENGMMGEFKIIRFKAVEPGAPGR